MTPLPLILALAQGGDPRLALRATLERPRVTFAEFGAWVQNRTHVPVTVSPAIRARKATVLVADRPVRETMDRFAETFFLEWETTESGLRLRMLPKVAAEEGDVLEAEARKREAAFRAAIQVAMELSGKSPEEIEETERDLGHDAGAEAQGRYMIVSRFAHDPAALAAGELLAALSPSQRTSLLAGGLAFGSDRGGAGMAAISKRWAAELAKGFEDAGDPEAPPKPVDGLLVMLRGDPAHGRLKAMAVPRTREGEAVAYSNTYLEGDGLPFDADTALDARLRAWAKADAGLLATPLRKDPEPLAAHSSSRRAMADLLLSLHRRSGLPIVADGFREAVSDGRTVGGSDVAGWLKLYANDLLGTTPAYVARTSGGWLTMRRVRYWERLDREPGEAAVAALERAVPTLDALAAFAATVAPVQEDYLGVDQLVMDVPNAALEGNLPFLRLWRALTGPQRRQAVDGELSMRDLTGEAARLGLDALSDFGGADGVNVDALLPHLLPGGPPLPKDLTLSVEANDDMTAFEFPTFNRRYDPNARPTPTVRRSYRGFFARIDGGERSYATFEFPLREKIGAK